LTAFTEGFPLAAEVDTFLVVAMCSTVNAGGRNPIAPSCTGQTN
jgi:hypothetical protein